MKTRIRFSAIEDKFYVERLDYSAFWFKKWVIATQKDGYSSSNSSNLNREQLYSVRYFNDFNQAKQFASKLAVDVLIENKVNEYDPVNGKPPSKHDYF